MDYADYVKLDFIFPQVSQHITADPALGSAVLILFQIAMKGVPFMSPESNEANYVIKETKERYSFPYDYRQSFHHKFSLARSMPEYITVKNFIGDQPSEQQIVLECLVYLSNFRFATKLQLECVLKAKNVDTDNLGSLLDKYVDARVINYFWLAAFEMDTPPKNALLVYCLDHCARYILNHFYKDDLISWLSSDNYVSTEILTKCLTTNLFYLQLLTAKGKALRFFSPLYDVNIGKRSMRFSGAFQIIQNGQQKDFILESVKSSDLPILWKKKVDQQIMPFVQNYWKKYYQAEPVLVLLVESESDVFETADIYYRRTESTLFRVTTEQEIDKGFEHAVFFKYNPQTEDHPQPEITKVRPSVFAPFQIKPELKNS